MEILVLDGEQFAELLGYNNATGLQGDNICVSSAANVPAHIRTAPQSYFAVEWAEVSEGLTVTARAVPPEETHLIVALCSVVGSSLPPRLTLRSIFNPLYPHCKQLHSVRVTQIYAIFSYTYLLITLVWGYVLLRYRGNTIATQKVVISSVLVSCCVDYFLSLALWRHCEESAFVSPSLSVLAALFSAWRCCYSRALLLVMCSGLGVTTDTLGGRPSSILQFAGCYLVASFVCTLSLVRSVLRPLQLGTVIAWGFLFVLNFLLFRWALKYVTEVKATLIPDSEKSRIYERLGKVLGLARVVGVCWLVYEG